MEEGNEAPILIKWEKKFELGIHVIDEQHKHLAALCNELHGQILRFRSGSTSARSLQEALSYALRETVAYSITHFKTEEKLMQAAGFYGLEKHKESHREFANRVKSMLLTFDNATVQNALEFSNFLYEWILAHIAAEDKLYVHAVREYMNKQH